MKKNNTNNNATQKKGFKYYAKAFALSAAIALPMLFKSLSASDATEPEVLAETIDLESLRGEDGKDGIDGINGRDGIDGINGQDGRNGVDGQDGRDGIDGVDGKDGVDGRDGIDGKDGVDGADGQDGVSATFDVQYIEGGYEITLTDVNHTETITLMNGKVETQYVEVEHKYTSKVTKEATCTASGVRTYSCDECDDTYTEAIEATGHSYQATNSVVNADSTVTVTYVCDNCGDSYNNTVGTPVHVHNAARTARENEVAATCTTADSYDAVVYCECGEELSRETIIGTELGHNYVVDEATAIAPQPGVAGKEADEICTRCGDVIEGDVIGALHAHAVANTVTENVVEATCVNGGSYDEVSYCECGMEMNRETKTTDALGHAYETTTVAPTETEEGYDLHVCGRCGDSYKDNFVGKVHVHAALDAVVENEVEATCCENGSYDLVVYCNCGEELSRETKSVDALGHNYVVDNSTAVEPQVGVAGKEADSICDRCGDVVTGSEIAALVDYSTTRCEFNEFGWGFYTNLEGESICTTRGAYIDYLAANYPGATICEDAFAIWCEQELFFTIKYCCSCVLFQQQGLI